MNVLGAFDGLSCGQIALERAGIKIDKYFASEIDKHAIQVTQKNYPKTIQLGNIEDWRSWDLPKLHLAMGGSPCQDLSQIKNDGKGLEGEKSKVFFEYVEVLNNLKPDYFLYENVASMKTKDRNIITECLGVEPVEISSKHFSAQDRPRLYWTNIPFSRKLPENNSITADILEHDVDEKYFYNDEFEVFNGFDKRVVGTLNRRYPNGKIKFTETTSRVYNPAYKMACLTAVSGGHQEKKVLTKYRVRKLTPLEYERLQTVPEGYTSSVSDSQRYKMLGNGWTVDVIAHILKGLKNDGN